MYKDDIFTTAVSKLVSFLW